MFVITIDDKKHLWHNRLNDDFLSAVERHFAATPGELGAEYLPDDLEAQIKGKMNRDPDALWSFDLSVDGKLKLMKADQDGVLWTELECDLVRVVSWARDENGKFLGNVLEEPT